MPQEHCWEFKKCHPDVRDKCPAYTTGSATKCWITASNFCPFIKRGYKFCFDCDWFKKQNPNFEEENQIHPSKKILKKTNDHKWRPLPWDRPVPKKHQPEDKKDGK